MISYHIYVLHVLPYQLMTYCGYLHPNQVDNAYGAFFPLRPCFSSLLLRVLVFVCNIDYLQHWRCRIKFLRHSLCPLTFVGLIPPDWIQVPVTLTQTVPKLSCQFRHFVTSCFVAHGIRHSRTLIRIQASSDLSQTPLVHFGTFASSVLVYLELDTTTLVTSRSIFARQTQCLGS